MKIKTKTIIAAAISFILIAATVGAGIVLSKKDKSKKDDSSETKSEVELESNDVVIPPINSEEETNESDKADIDVGEMTRGPEPSIGDIIIEIETMEDVDE